MTKKTTRAVVSTVAGLQSLLADGVEVLSALEQRDLAWSRVMISAVSSGNALIRTQHMLESMKKTPRGK
jgi:hypothetical protein